MVTPLFAMPIHYHLGSKTVPFLVCVIINLRKSLVPSPPIKYFSANTNINRRREIGQAGILQK
jgi:hypothetical protein